MNLSVCLLSGHADTNLARSLDSVRETADEIVLTDTGLSDRVQTLASRFKARVSGFPWCEDCAAARNHCLAQARGDWILWLDADEVLLPEQGSQLKRLLTNPDALAYYVSCQDVANEDCSERFTQMWQLRLFRNRDDLRYLGRCSPRFDPPVQEIGRNENLSILPSSITLRHFGAESDATRNGLQQKLRLLELELRERPGQLPYLIECGRTRLALGDPGAPHYLAEAARKTLSFWEEGRVPPAEVATLLEYLLQLREHDLPGNLTHAMVKAMVKAWFPRAASLQWILAREALVLGEFFEAERLLQNLIRLGQEESFDRFVSFEPRVVMEDALLNLGVCLFRLGKHQEAEVCFQQLLDQGVRVKEALSNLKAIHRSRQREAT